MPIVYHIALVLNMSLYVYEYFHRQGQPQQSAFAAVPLSQRGRGRRQFDPQGLPLCQAGLPMPLKYTLSAALPASNMNAVVTSAL